MGIFSFFSKEKKEKLDKGLEKTAELLIAISYGERLINRIHSAALDGHHDEAVECTEEAHAAFKEVFKLTVRVWKFENKPT